MEHGTAITIARQLAPVATKGVTEDRDAIGHVAVRLSQALSVLPETEIDFCWVDPANEAKAFLMPLAPADAEPGDDGNGFLFEVTAGARPNSDDESRPFATLSAKTHRLDPPSWDVGVALEFAPSDEGGLGSFRTRWQFNRDEREVLSVEGKCTVWAEASPEHQDWAEDEAEKFAQLLAGRVAWPPLPLSTRGHTL